MKILYVSQYFPPEMGAPAARVHELAKHWVQQGHQVTVLTGFPNHPTGVMHAEYRSKWKRLLYREKVDGIDVVRVWLLPLPNRKAHERILNYGSFWMSSSLTGMFLEQPDVVIGTSPQLLVGMSGWWVARVRRAPFVFEVRDLWPESLVAVGVSGRKSILYRTLGRIAKFLYRHCDHLVVVTPAFKEYLADNWRIPSERMSVVENGVETDLFSPGEGRQVKREFGLDGRFVLSYIGTLGMAHGLETVLAAAEQLLASNAPVTFLLVGEGAENQKLREIAARRGLSNVIFFDQKPRAQMPGIIRASDACLVTLKKTEIFTTVIPTKLLEFMSCGRPVILAVDGQARKIVEAAEAGLYVEPENAAAFVDAVSKLAADPDLRQRLGANGRRWTIDHLSRAKTAEKYIDVLESVRKRSHPLDAKALNDRSSSEKIAAL
jgi:glycosyltransferase involved in cell wall biosynthesis